MVVLEQIDPQDWARPGADAIVQRVKEQRNEGNIVLLHDAGGDRSQTVEALPRIIDYLQTRGDQIVPLSTLINTPARRADAADQWRECAARGAHGGRARASASGARSSDSSGLS